MELKFGYCAYCGESIMDIMKRKLAQNFRTLWLLLSDGSKMRVGVCEKCYQKPTKKMRDTIIEKHRKYWLSETENEKKKYKILGLIAKEIKQKEKDLAFHHSIAKSYSFSPTTVARSSEVNQNFDDVITSLKANHHEDADGTTVIPVGTIVMWSGSIVSIPAKWHICDGTGGTIDLRDKFIVGAGSTYNVADTGGATTHIHAVDPPSTTSSSYNPADTIDEPGSGGTPRSVVRSAHSHTVDIASFNSDPGSSLPPYYALAYIQYIG